MFIHPQCYEPCGLEAFYHEVYNTSRKSIMVMGGTCSHVTEATAQVAHLWGIPQISYSALSPHLSNQEIFPTFFRVISPEHYLTSARIELLKAYGWNRVHTIYQNKNLFSTLDESMRQELKDAGIEVLTSGQAFTDDPTQNVQDLIKKDARIIFASMYEDKLRQVMCKAYHLTPRPHLWYKRVVWLLPWYIDLHWINRSSDASNCTSDQIKEVAGNYFSVGSSVISEVEDYKAVGGFVPVQFARNYTGQALYEAARDMIPSRFHHLYRDALQQSHDTSLPNEHRAGHAYDCMWAIAVALNNTLNYLKDTSDHRRLEDFEYRNQEFSKLLHQAMVNVTFNALSGPFAFNDKGEKPPVVDIFRYNNSHPPVDGIQTKNRLLEVPCSLLYVFRCLACLGILLSLSLLAFNISNRNHRVIKMSSPHLNNVILLGCILAYCNVLLLAISVHLTTPLCMIRIATIVLSFSLSFGALFAKTWRVYQIFAAGSTLKRLGTKVLRDSRLLAIVLALVLFNSSILVTWSVMSPEKPILVNISETLAGPWTDTRYINQHERCESRLKTQFTWAALSVQGVVILAGTFLAVQTRKVYIPELNDSKRIGMCIYNVVVLCPVGVVVVMATEKKPSVNFVLESTIIILVTTMTQALLFVPKILAYRKHNNLYPRQSEGRLSQISGIFAFIHRNSGRRSTKSTSAGSASSRSREPSWTGREQTSGDHKFCENCIQCSRCQSRLSVVSISSSHFRLQRNSLQVQGGLSLDASALDSHRPYTLEERSTGATRSGLPCSRYQTHHLPGGQLISGLWKVRRNSDSSLYRNNMYRP
ncbi:gamma-aminobutyric acid type b receptor subunit 2 [Plakobranchus ocellatus]|uniref:Gamma-aminobutyric acid type b receptor subunit 2 n=1 Tax=Plakobranchus ocellatus TaxID=259542 RepID=A0AAV4D848_9GAST|nr:gamma-aminobutyric acid type b receptor subunit 2 [Plakobranchus ocellatus]